MKDLRNWLSSRVVVKSTQADSTIGIAEVLSGLKNELTGPQYSTLITNLTATLPKEAQSWLSASTAEALIIKTQKYLQDPTFRGESLSKSQSGFHRKWQEKAIASAWVKIGDILQHLSVGALEKAIKPSDFNRIKNKHNEDFRLTVDHTKHLQDFRAPQEYTRMLSDPKTFASAHKDLDGIGAKAVHNTTGYTDPTDNTWTSYAQPHTFMTKPYHKTIESTTTNYTKHPITGWATMATKALFNAGDIGHLAEDVTMHEHEGVPVTVHKFHPNMVAVGDIKNTSKNNANPLHIHQVAAMDYLTNNTDRHWHNIMISPERNSEGYNPILAIDHERNFQYHKPLSSFDKFAPTSNNFTDYYNTLHEHKLNNNPFDNWGEFADWWNQKGPAIKDAFLKHVEAIKDPEIRQHVADNFMDRHEKLSSWAKDAHDWDIFDVNSPNTPTQSHLKPFKRQSLSNASIKRLLPKDDHIRSLNILMDNVNHRARLTPKQHHLIQSTLTDIVEGLSPEQSAQTLKHVMGSPKFSSQKAKKHSLDVRNMILNHASQPHYKDGQPQYNLAHMQALVQAIDEMPRHEILSQWRDHFLSHLHGQDRQAA